MVLVNVVGLVGVVPLDVGELSVIGDDAAV